MLSAVPAATTLAARVVAPVAVSKQASNSAVFVFAALPALSQEALLTSFSIIA